MGTIAKGLSLARPTTTEGDCGFTLRNRENLAKMIGNLHFDTWIERDDQGTMFSATDGDWGTHQHSFFGVVQQENSYMVHNSL